MLHDPALVWGAGRLVVALASEQDDADVGRVDDLVAGDVRVPALVADAVGEAERRADPGLAGLEVVDLAGDRPGLDPPVDDAGGLVPVELRLVARNQVAGDAHVLAGRR